MGSLLRIIVICWIMFIVCSAQTETTNNVPSSTLEVTSETETATSNTTLAPTCGICNFNVTCSACGSFTLPSNPQSGTSVLYAKADSYVELRLDARMLFPGEILILSDENAMMRVLGAPHTEITCNSNMDQDTYVYRAWSGTLTLKLSYKDASTSKCDDSVTVTRVMQFQSVPLGTNDGRIEGTLEFPESGEIPPSSGGEWGWPIPVTSQGGGFGVNITVEMVNLDASLDDYLTINAGLHNDPANAVVFSWSTDKSNKREIRLVGRDSFYTYLHLGERTAGQSMEGIGFKLKYTTKDEVTEAPTTPSTTTPLPTAPSNISDTIEVYIGGMTPEEFVSSETLEEFRESMATLANKFCEMNAIDLMKPINQSAVLIHTVERCPSSWPMADVCVSTIFAVPAFTEPLENETESSYELTSTNLRQMWNLLSLDEYSSYLPEPLFPYYEPEPVFWWWIGITLGVLVLVILLIIVAWRIEVHHSIMSYSKSGSLIGSGSSTRGSGSWEANTLPHQVVPPYLVMDAEQDGKMPDLYSGQDWGFADRSSYSVTGGMVNDAYDDDEEIDVFGQRQLNHESDSDDEIVQTIRPDNRLDPIYDTPSVIDRHIKLGNDLDAHLSETNL